jgi:TonB family protein
MVRRVLPDSPAWFVEGMGQYLSSFELVGDEARIGKPGSAVSHSPVQGVVMLESVIGLDGRVADVRVLRSIPLLDSAAIDAVKQWEFESTLLDGVPVPVVMTVTVQFTLGGPPATSETPPEHEAPRP